MDGVSWHSRQVGRQARTAQLQQPRAMAGSCPIRVLDLESGPRVFSMWTGYEKPMMKRLLVMP